MSSEKEEILKNLEAKKLESEEKYNQILSEELEAYEDKCDALREEKELEEIEITSKIQVLKTKQKGLTSKLRAKLKLEEKKHKERCKELQKQASMDKEYYDTFIVQCIKSHSAAAMPDEDSTLDNNN
jgi:hypothetical protein